MADNPIKHSDIIQDGNPFDGAIKGIKEMIVLLDKMGKEIKEGATEWAKFASKQNATTKKGQEGLKKAADETQKLTVKEKERLKIVRQLEQAEAKAELINSAKYKQLIKTKGAINAQTAAMRQAEKAQRTGVKTTNTWSKALGSFAAKFNTIGNIASNVASVIARTFTRALKGAIDTVVEFDQAMADVKAISQATDKEFKKLRDSAKALGGSTKFTASQVAGLQKEYAKLGFTTEQILELQSATLDLAVATGADLGDAALIVGGAMRAYGLEMKDAAGVSATLAVATTKSALTFEDYSTTLSTLAPVARAFGFSLEDTIALMGQLKNANFDTSKAATATRNILLNLADANGALAQRLGGSVNTLEGLIDGLQRLDDENVNLAEALDLTDKRSVSAFLALSNTAKGAVELRDSISEVNDELEDMVEIMEATIENRMKILKSSWDKLVQSQVDATDAVEGTKGAIETTSDALSLLSEHPNEARAAFKLFATSGSFLREQLENLIRTTSLMSISFKDFSEIAMDDALKKASEAAGVLMTDQERFILGVKKAREGAALREKVLADAELKRIADAEIAFEASEKKRLKGVQAMIDKRREERKFEDDSAKIREKYALDEEKLTDERIEDLDSYLESLMDADETFIEGEEAKTAATLSEIQKRSAARKIELEDEDKRKEFILRTIEQVQQVSDAFNSYQQSQIDNKYNAEIEAADGNAKKIEEIQIQQAKEQQDLAVKMAIINGALSATKTQAQLGAFSLPALILSAAIIAFQVSAIKSQKFAEGGHGLLGDKGGVLSGPSHAGGGVNLGEIGEAEGSEYFGIINKRMTSKYKDDLPTIFDSLNRGKFHDVFSRANIELNKGGIFKDPYTKKMYETMLRQANTYEDSDGNQVVEYMNGRKRTIRKHV